MNMQSIKIKFPHIIFSESIMMVIFSTFQTLHIATILTSLVTTNLRNAFHYCGFVIKTQIAVMEMMSQRISAKMLVHVEAVSQLRMG